MHHPAGGESRFYRMCARYVSENLFTTIRTEQMAQELGYTRAYLCTRFKQEAGISLIRYIQEEKTAEAKRLLQFTDQDLGQSYEEYHNFASKYLQKDKVIYNIFVYDEETMSTIRSLCKENMVSVNDYLTAKMFEEDKTDKVIIASDLRKLLHCYSQGALGNYSTAFSVRLKGKSLAQTLSETLKLISRETRFTKQKNLRTCINRAFERYQGSI